VSTSAITPGERRELKVLVAKRFKVLRSEMEVRQRELAATIDNAIVEKHETRDFQRSEVERMARRLLEDVQRQVDAELSERREVVGMGRFGIGYPGFRWDDDGRSELRRAALSDLDAKVKAAKLRLDREEVDLLQSLAIGALETDEAHAFLRGIPTVSELVPAARLEELEASLVTDEP